VPRRYPEEFLPRSWIWSLPVTRWRRLPPIWGSVTRRSTSGRKQELIDSVSHLAHPVPSRPRSRGQATYPGTRAGDGDPERTVNC
jgi:hypothetical protein